MPLELGLDLGCRRFGQKHHQTKISLVLDIKPYRYQKFISDISGQDIYAHGGKESKGITLVRDWLSTGSRFIVPSGRNILYRYKRFQEALPALCMN